MEQKNIYVPKSLFKNDNAIFNVSIIKLIIDTTERSKFFSTYNHVLCNE